MIPDFDVGGKRKFGFFSCSRRRFVCAIISCHKHLATQTMAAHPTARNPSTLGLVGHHTSSRIPLAESHKHTRTHTSLHVRAFTHTRERTHTHACTHADTHTRPRCALLTPSPGFLQRVLVQFSRTHSSAASLSLPPSLSPSLSLSLDRKIVV